MADRILNSSNIPTIANNSHSNIKSTTDNNSTVNISFFPNTGTQANSNSESDANTVLDIRIFFGGLGLLLITSAGCLLLCKQQKLTQRFSKSNNYKSLSDEIETDLSIETKPGV